MHSGSRCQRPSHHARLDRTPGGSKTTRSTSLKGTGSACLELAQGGSFATGLRAARHTTSGSRIERQQSRAESGVPVLTRSPHP